MISNYQAEGVAPSAEIELEKKRDDDERSRLVRAQYLKVTHLDMIAEGRHLRFVHRRLLQQEKKSSLAAEDVIEACGGLDRIVDEGAMASNVVAVASAGKQTANSQKSTMLANMNHLLALQATPSGNATKVTATASDIATATANANATTTAAAAGTGSPAAEDEKKEEDVAMQQHQEMIKTAHEYSNGRVPGFNDLDVVLTEEEKLLSAASASLASSADTVPKAGRAPNSTTTKEGDNDSVGIVPHNNIDNIEGKEQSALEHGGKDRDKGAESSSQSLTGGLQEIPRALLLDLLGHIGVDGRRNRVPKWAIDPYPPSQKHSHLTAAEMTALRQREKKEKEQRRKHRHALKAKRLEAIRAKEKQVEAMGGALGAGLDDDDDDDVDEDAVIAQAASEADAGGDDDEDEDDEDEDEEEDLGAPMADVMFKWLCSKLHLSRPSALPPAIGDRGQHVASPIALRIDRLHCESSMVLNDSGNSLIILQILQGVVNGQPLMNDNMTGASS